MLLYKKLAYYKTYISESYTLLALIVRLCTFLMIIHVLKKWLKLPYEECRKKYTQYLFPFCAFCARK